MTYKPIMGTEISWKEKFIRDWKKMQAEFRAIQSNTNHRGDPVPDGDTLVVIWLKLLTLAGVTNDKGWVYFTQDIPYTDELLATQFNRPINTIRLALQVFQQFQMIEVVDDVIHVSNWEKYQNVEGMEKVREQTRKRVARFREKQKQIACNDTVTLRNGTDIEEDKELEKEKSSNRFTPPTLDEVTAYCTERNNKVDPQRFIDYYSSQNWKKSNGQKVADWKACVRTWEQREKKDKKTAFNSFEQRTYDYADLTERLMAKG